MIVDDKLKYFEIKATGQDRDWELSHRGDKEVYASCYNFTENYKKSAPDGLKTAKFSSEYFVQRAT